MGQFAADGFELQVAGGFGLGGEQGVEQAGLAGAEAEMIFLGLAETGEGGDPGEPLLGQQPVGAVVEPDHVLAALDGGKQLRQGGNPAVEVDFAVQLEPVDAGADVDAGGAVGANELAGGFHLPAGGGERLHHFGQPLGGNDPDRLAGFRVGIQAESAERLASGCFGGGIAGVEPASLGIEHSGSGARRHVAAVFEQESAFEAALPAVSPLLRADAEDRAGSLGHVLELHASGHGQAAEVRDLEDNGEQFVALGGGGLDGTGGAERGEPAKGSREFETRHTILKEDEVLGQEQRGGQVDLLLPVADGAAELDGVAFLGEAEGGLPGPGIPGQGLEIRAAAADPHAPGLGERGDEPAGNGRRQAPVGLQFAVEEAVGGVAGDGAGEHGQGLAVDGVGDEVELAAGDAQFLRFIPGRALRFAFAAHELHDQAVDGGAGLVDIDHILDLAAFRPGLRAAAEALLRGRRMRNGVELQAPGRNALGRGPGRRLEVEGLGQEFFRLAVFVERFLGAEGDVPAARRVGQAALLVGGQNERPEVLADPVRRGPGAAAGESECGVFEPNGNVVAFAAADLRVGKTGAAVEDPDPLLEEVVVSALPLAPGKQILELMAQHARVFRPGRVPARSRRLAADCRARVREREGPRSSGRRPRARCLRRS